MGKNNRMKRLRFRSFTEMNLPNLCVEYENMKMIN